MFWPIHQYSQVRLIDGPAHASIASHSWIRPIDSNINQFISVLTHTSIRPIHQWADPFMNGTLIMFHTSSALMGDGRRGREIWRSLRPVLGNWKTPEDSEERGLRSEAAGLRSWNGLFLWAGRGLFLFIFMYIMRWWLQINLKIIWILPHL